MSQNVTLSATISAAQSRRAGIEALASKESEQWSVDGSGLRDGPTAGGRGAPVPSALSASNSDQRSVDGSGSRVEFPIPSAFSTHYRSLCTAVDRRWKKGLQVPLSATFPDVSPIYQVPELDRQVVPCEADRT
jgi:hypothetical protein